jgi:hypothetical protein
VVQFIPKIKELFLKLKADEFWDPNQILLEFVHAAQFENAKNCSKLSIYLNEPQSELLCAGLEQRE